MKTFLVLTVLTASGLMILSACRTAEGPRPDRKVVAKQRGSSPRPYYESNSEGNYYYSTTEDTNTEYQPQVKRN